MFCVHCGSALVAGEPFCPRCGKPAGGVPTPAAPAPSRLSGNLRLLGFLWIALSVLRLVPGLILLSIFGSIESFLPQDVPAFIYPIMHFVAYLFIGSAGVGFLAGWGLLQRQPWARMLGIVLGLLSLIDIPFGTAIGIYTLWVLVPAASEEEYRRITQPA